LLNKELWVFKGTYIGYEYSLKGKNKTMRLLLVEDDIKIALFIKNGLRPYDLAIIDLMLPKTDGLTIIDEMRRNNINTPVLILSAKRSVDDRVKGLKTGGDDYLTKPFAFSELLARIQALIRRASGVTSPSSLTYADLTMNLHTRKVFRSGSEIDLQPLEFSLLEYLMRNAGRVVSKTMIMEHVWDYNFSPQTNVVEARICYLRDKIDKNIDKKLIHTVRGVGYVLKEDS
jgi:two-component system OmpR family response regulator